MKRKYLRPSNFKNHGQDFYVFDIETGRREYAGSDLHNYKNGVIKYF